MRRVRTALAVALLAAAPALTACGGPTDASGASEPASGSQELTVLAAASLTEVFDALGEQFEADNPGVTVTFAFDSSATLATQAAEGAPADVLATADERTMEDAVAADAVTGTPTVFAENRLVLVTPADNPGGVRGVEDLAREDVDYVVCVPSAPCGDLAARALEVAGVDADAASQEVDVKAVLAKVTADEADAGIVYATDALAAGDQVQVLDLAGAESLITSYPVAVLAQAEANDLAARWIELLQSAPGRDVLRDAGFDTP
ncbi:molybdate ABC transporter substrate-binding protein [Nocardioidaceae bacterium]|nr:molybdate ABC transporter substrate-binding protein [Nocardioidaceae bacterium]